MAKGSYRRNGIARQMALGNKEFFRPLRVIPSSDRVTSGIPVKKAEKNPALRRIIVPHNADNVIVAGGSCCMEPIRPRTIPYGFINHKIYMRKAHGYSESRRRYNALKEMRGEKAGDRKSIRKAQFVEREFDGYRYCVPLTDELFESFAEYE